MDCFCLFPAGMVSEPQERQMVHMEAANVHAIKVDNADSDATDVVIKGLFNDAAFAREHNLVSVNSFNVARVLVQSVPFFWSYLRVCSGEGDMVVSVPSGGLGHSFGGWIARQMGVPMHLVLAANANATVPRFLSTGKYEPRPTVATLSNAMDIAVP
mmetsp:Transcript_49473/g.116141  ORF Transcript_49473/g.116141 Transcript_49473/m.116141 type:complete len:157 (-) Transcript_49473:31-501(-)